MNITSDWWTWVWKINIFCNVLVFSKEIFWCENLWLARHLLIYVDLICFNWMFHYSLATHATPTRCCKHFTSANRFGKKFSNTNWRTREIRKRCCRAWPICKFTHISDDIDRYFITINFQVLLDCYPKKESGIDSTEEIHRQIAKGERGIW